MTALDLDQIRARIEQGLALCPHEHTIHQLAEPGDPEVIIGCECHGDPDVIDRFNLGDPGTFDATREIQLTVIDWQRRHERQIVDRIILDLIGRPPAPDPDLQNALTEIAEKLAVALDDPAAVARTLDAAIDDLHRLSRIVAVDAEVAGVTPDDEP